MDEQKDTYSCTEENAAADAQNQPAACELEDISQGSAATGILGALLGALIGAIPWFLASTFTNYFIGLLGFLAGVAACYGYRLFHGRRSTGFAMATVVISSILAIFIAQMASWMYILCTDPGWQADAAQMGIPVALLAWDSLMMPDNWSILAPDMIVGMLIGVLGIASVRKYVLTYTNPSQVEPSADATLRINAETTEGGTAVLDSFTVKDGAYIKTLLRIIGVAGIVFFLSVFGGVISSSFSEPQEYTIVETIVLSAFSLIMVFLCIFLLFNMRRKLVVEGNEISYRPTFGKTRTFHVTDIAGVRISVATGHKLISRDGEVLARFEDNQINSNILWRYLSAHGIGLLVK